MPTDRPHRIGPYVVDRTLGSGGMGEVVLAFSPAGSPVAVKLIRADRLGPDSRDRFRREADIARTVRGTDRVARFLDADPDADRPWMALEYVQGRTLLAHVEAEGPLPPVQVASLGALLAEGLAAVHAVGLVHRDLKPQNVMLGANGPVIIDFGLGAFVDARQDSLTGSGVVVGTVRSMPPEQATGGVGVTAAADVYALGAVLLHAATGHPPYDGERWEVILRRVTDPAVPPDLSGLPGSLVPLVSSLLAHDPSGRPATAQVQQACADLLGDLGTDPRRARWALLDATAPPARRREPEPSPGAVDVLRQGAERSSGTSGSGDGEVAAERPVTGSTPAGAAARPPGPPSETGPDTGSGHVTVGSGRRPPRVVASVARAARTAEALRREYAVGGAF